MSNKENRAFVKGALILMIANIAVKIIGALFKIPLNYLIGDDGMGYFGSAYTVYNWLFIVATAGFPVAISKMVSESRAKGNYKEAQNIFSVSFKLLLFIGIMGCALLYFGAEKCAGIMANDGAALGIKALAPAILFVSVMSVYRGYFQGRQNMLPTAVSEVCEALGKLIVGYIGASVLLKYGLEYASAGAVAGVSAGGFFAMAALVFIYAKSKKHKDKVLSDGVCRSNGRLLKDLIKIAVPITIGASVFSLTTLIDAAMIMRRLQESAGFSYRQANALWGAYTGKSITMFNLVPTLITAVSISIVPTVSAAFAKNNKEQTQSATLESLKITVLLTAPCAVGMSILAGPILTLIFHSSSAQSTLMYLAYAIIFVSLVTVTNAILQATGNAGIPVIHMAVGGAVKVAVNYILVGMPSINIVGAPIGTNCCYIVILILNLISIKRIMGIKLSAPQLIFKPLVSVAAMAAAVLAVSAQAQALGNTLNVLVSIITGAAVYAVVLLAVGGINEQDILMLPKSDKILSKLKKLKIIKH